MKRLLILTAVLMLSACSGGCAEIDASRAAIAEHGADASDQALDTAIWTMCNATPVGAIKRRFKTEAERDAYNKLCPGEPLP